MSLNYTRPTLNLQSTRGILSSGSANNKGADQLAHPRSLISAFTIHLLNIIIYSDCIWPILLPYMGVIPNPKMAFIFPISCILVSVFPISMIYFPKYEGKGSFPKSQIKSLIYKIAPSKISLFYLVSVAEKAGLV